MRCTLRFSNKRYVDDAALDMRGVALRLDPGGGAAPLDLYMSTGSFGHAYNVVQLAAIRWAPAWLRKRWLQASHTAREASAAGLRRAPSSYAGLTYYSQLVRLWVGVSQSGHHTSRRCRLRLVPMGLQEESGLPDAVDEDNPWDTARRPNEARPPGYLRSELSARLETTPVSLVLEAQVAEGDDTDDEAVDEGSAWYDASIDWDAVSLPWHRVGVVTLNKALADDVTERLTFDPSHGAGVLATPLSPSWRDPRSLAATQDRVVRLVGRLRRRRGREWLRPKHAPPQQLPNGTGPGAQP